ncbi:MAG: ferrous iron transport protein B [Anaerolineae bacterium]|nr:ferrous iron transport protein B [Anaerolineae bacterium]
MTSCPRCDAHAPAGETLQAAASSPIIALAGNPNAGKSTIFNALTGDRQHVGNWPGKTVAQKAGLTTLNGQTVTVVDLPGAYSLTAYSGEEIVTRDFVIEQHPDAVVAVVDATNLERNLYLVIQLLELGVPLVVAVNMIDVARQRSIAINFDALSAALGGVPVVATAARHGVGLDTLRQAMRRAITAPGEAQPDHNGSGKRACDCAPVLDYGELLEGQITALQAHLANGHAPASPNHTCPARWLAIKLLEEDAGIRSQVAQTDADLLADVQARSEHVTALTGEAPETLLVDRRYAFIADVVAQAISQPAEIGLTASERLDAVLTHRWLGVPIFLLMMWLVFQLVANVSAPLLDWVDATISGPVASWVMALLGTVGLTGTWIESLLVDGIIAGVGGVLAFLPVLFFLYLAIAILEDSGYMARAAFVMDRFMHALGLHGKSFLPMMVGFGCTVPAIYTTRTLENEADRRLTGFLITFMSCGARLPVYVIFGTAFFGAASGNLVFAMYILGVLIAILTGVLLRHTIFRNKTVQPFVLELPPYRALSVKALWSHITGQTADFVRNVWTTIMFASIVIWLLLAVPLRGGVGSFADVEPQDSLFGGVSRLLAPVFAPAGFDNWESTGALVTGLVAKEVVISTLSVAYADTSNAAPPSADEDTATTLGDDLTGIARGLGDALVLTVQEAVNIVPRTLNIVPGMSIPAVEFLPPPDESGDSGLEAALREHFTPLAAVAFNVFVLLYMPCMTSVGAMRHEFGGRWALFQIGYTMIVAWIAAVAVYQGGLLLGFG